ncbi:hypothetical protein OROGR_016236 [Orobanche gracilis]
MEYNKTTKILVVVLFLVFLIIPNHRVCSSSSLSSPFFEEKRFCFFTPKGAVRIINGLPENSPPLKIHCASGDDDLGFHDLGVNQDFKWSFCQNMVTNTLFFCHLWWGSKNRAFVAYDSRCTSICSKCTWTAKSDGIYGNKKRILNWEI